MESPWELVHAEKPLLRRWPHTTDQPREQSREVNSASRAEGRDQAAGVLKGAGGRRKGPAAKRGLGATMMYR